LKRDKSPAIRGTCPTNGCVRTEKGKGERYEGPPNSDLKSCVQKTRRPHEGMWWPASLKSTTNKKKKKTITKGGGKGRDCFKAGGKKKKLRMLDLWRKGTGRGRKTKFIHGGPQTNSQGGLRKKEEKKDFPSSREFRDRREKRNSD